MLTKLYVAAQVKSMMLKDTIRNILSEERGEVNIIAIVIILAIALALAVIFKDNIEQIFDSIWNGIFEDVSKLDL
mgnify:CR=1 FL=1